MGEWNLQGLPTDDLSTQNGIMVTRATRYPVLVDPQGQGLSWIKAREEANQLKVTALSERQFRNHLEDALAYGKPLLVENIEEDLDPLLDPVLEKRYIRKGKNFMIQLADKEVDFTESFALFFTTRLPNPHYSPELSAKVTVIDFTVTLVGLEDQLLGRLILKEKHELEEQRQARARPRLRSLLASHPNPGCPTRAHAARSRLRSCRRSRRLWAGLPAAERKNDLTAWALRLDGCGAGAGGGGDGLQEKDQAAGG